MLRSSLKFGASLLIAALLLYVIFYYVEFDAVVGALAQARTEWVIAALFCLALERIAGAARMRILSDRLELSLSTYKIFEISTVATFYGLFAPGELGGGAVRWYRMSRPTGRRAQVVAAIVVERIVDTIVLVVCGLVFWFLDSPPFDRTIVNVTLLAALCGLMLLLALAVSAHTSAAFRWSISWIPWEKVRGKLVATAEKVFLSMRTLRDLSVRQMALVWLLSLARVLVAVVMLVCFAVALGMQIDFVTVGWIRSFLNIITMLPISFSGLGVREGSLVLLLAPYGVPAALAVAFSLMHFFVYVVMAAVGGVLEVKNLALLGQSRRTITTLADGDEDAKRT